MAKIYVGNLPFTTTDEELRTLFSQHGTVESVSLPTDRETGRPRGFAFVEMSQADASRAIQSLNGKDLGDALCESTRPRTNPARAAAAAVVVVPEVQVAAVTGAIEG